MPAPIVSEASSPTVEPVTPTLQERLTSELDTAHALIDAADSFLHVCNIALRHQDCDVDGDVADVLDAAWEKISAARDAIVSATDLLPEVCDGR